MNVALLSISKVAQTYLYHFYPPSPAHGAVAIGDLLSIDPLQNQQLADQFTHLAKFLNQTLVPNPTDGGTNRAGIREPLRDLGRQIYNHWLPRTIQQALEDLPAGTPLILATNDSDFPWEMAHDGQDHLAFKYSLARQWLAPSLPRPRTASSHLWSALLIGNPTGDLPASAQEIRAIADLLAKLPNAAPPRIFMRHRAQKQTLLQELSSGAYHLIHFSGHALFTDGDPSASGLLLADGEVLTALEIERSASGRPFIFLNACESGRAVATHANGGLYLGGGAQGLAMAFLRSGALGFIGSFWPVLDTGSCDTAIAFYRAITAGLTAGEALSAARRATRQTSPFDPVWASYLFYGAPTTQLAPVDRREMRRLTVLALRLDSLLACYADHTLEQGAILEDSLFNLLAVVLDRYGGQMRDRQGDRLLIHFGLPTAFEDSPMRALHAALALQESIQTFNQTHQDALSEPITLSAALSTGQLLVHRNPNPTNPITSTTSNVDALAAKLAEHADAGQIWLDQNTYQATKEQITIQSIASVHLTAHRQVDAFQLARLLAVKTPIALPILDLVGRTTELADLQQWWREAAAGQGRLVDLIGTVGVGKSHLVQTFRTSLTPQPHHWQLALCHSFDQEHTYALLTQILRALAQITPGEGEAAQRQKLSALIESALQTVAPANVNQAADMLTLLTQVLNLPIPAGEMAQVDPRLHPQRLAIALRLLLTYQTHSTPLVLVLEDLHWADEASLAVLRPLIPTLHQLPILLIAVYRPDFAPEWPISPRYRQVALAGLDDTAQQELLDTLLAGPVPATIGEQLFAQTGGNPLFLIAVVKELQERQWLVQTPDGWLLAATLDTLPLSDTLDAIIQARIDRLMAASREVLYQAAVIGSEFEHEVLAAVQSETEQAELTSSVDELTRREFIQATFNLSLTYAFSHALIHQTVYQKLLDYARRMIHRLVARAIQQLYGEQAIYRLAHHFYLSDDRLQAIRYALAAALRAAESGDNPNALRWCNRVLEQLDTFVTHPATELEQEAGATPAQLLQWRIAALEGRGEAQATLGANEAAIADYNSALALTAAEAPFSAEQRAALYRKLAIAHHDQSHYPDADAALTAGLALLGGATSVEAGRLHIWRGMVAVRRGQYEIGLAACQQALTLVQPATLAPDLSKVYNLLGIIYRRQGRSAEAIAVLEKNIALCQQADYKVGLGRAYSNLGCVYQDLGRWAEAIDYGQRSAVLCQRTGDVRQQAPVALDLGEIYRRQGQLDAALAAYREAQQIAEQFAFPEIQGMALVNQTACHLRRHDPVTAQQTLTAGQTILAGAGIDMYKAEVLRYQAEVAWQQGHLSQAMTQAQAALRTAQRLDEPLDIALAQRLLAQIAHTAGQSTEALQQLTQSLTLVRTQNSPHEIGLTLLALATVTMADPPHHEQAAAYCDEAIALFTNLGAALDLADARALRRSIEHGFERWCEIRGNFHNSREGNSL
jgi:tetratricopeptide (TPR) repeat protein/class 3 adenylate cyclase